MTSRLDFGARLELRVCWLYRAFAPSRTISSERIRLKLPENRTYLGCEFIQKGEHVHHLSTVGTA